LQDLSLSDLLNVSEDEIANNCECKNLISQNVTDSKNFLYNLSQTDL